MLLRIDEAALALGVSPRTVRRWLAKGAPHSRRGGTPRIDPILLAEWRKRVAVDSLLDKVSRS